MMLKENKLLKKRIRKLQSTKLAVKIAEHILTFTKERLKKDPPKNKAINSLSYSESNKQWSYSLEIKPDWEVYFRKYKKNVEFIPFDLGIKFTYALSLEGVFYHNLTNIEKIYHVQKHVFAQPLVDVILHYLKNNDIKKRFSKEAFINSYIELYSRWCCNLKKEVVITPLKGLVSSEEEIEISKYIRIVKITPEIVLQLWEISSGNASNFHDLLSNSHCLWMEFDGHENDKNFYKKIIDYVTYEVPDIVTSFRLLKEGTLGVSHTFNFSLLPYQQLHSQHKNFYTQIDDDDGANLYISEPYTLTKEDAEKIQNIYFYIRKVRLASNLKNIEICLNRFNITYRRELLEDAIIDLSIALESSLLFGVRDELKYRLTLRGVSLLSKKYSPEKACSILQNLYDARSSIVHNGSSLTSMRPKNLLNLTPKDFFKHSRRVVADILVEYLSSLQKGVTMDQIQNDLDTRILNSLTHIFEPKNS